MPYIAETVLEAAGIGGWELDVATSRLTWTPVTFRIHAWDRPEPPPLGEALAFYAPEAQPAVSAAIHAAIETGAPFEFEAPLVTANGRQLWIRSWGQAVRDNGRTVKLAGVIQDVTDRRELTGRTERLSIIAQQMSNIIITTDRDGRIDWVNAALTRLTGYTFEDMRGHKLGEMLQGPRTDPATIRQMTAGLRSGAGFEVEVVNYTKGGDPYWIGITCSPLQGADGALTGFIAVETEIGARHAAEAKAQEEAAKSSRAEALLQDVLDAIPSAVVAYDHDERLILTNPADAERASLPARFSTLGERLEDVMRLAVTHGYFPDSPPERAGQEAWLAQLMEFLRAPGGVPRVMNVKGGRSVQVRTRRSKSGHLVIVRTDITELVRAKSLLRDVLETLPSAVVAYDRDEQVILSNRAHAAMAPIVARFTAAGKRLGDVIRLSVEQGHFADAPSPPAERDAWVAELLAFFRAGSGESRALRLRSGRYMQVRTRRSETGNLVIIRTDITELLAARALLRDVLDVLPSPLLAYDKQECMILVNRAYRQMYPETVSHAVPGRRLEDFLRAVAEDGLLRDAGVTAESIEAWVATQLAEFREPGPVRISRLMDGRVLQKRVRQSESGNMVCEITDITDLRQAEDDLRQLAERDPLTQLFNRRSFVESLDRALTATEQGQSAGGLLLALDIDYFKQINDTLGHDMGDALLVEIASRLTRSIRGGDELAARLGGDEFGAVILGLTDPAAAAARMDGLLCALAAPVDLGGVRTPIGISMGVTAFPADGIEPAQLLKNADLALYQAKREGRGRWAPFHPDQATGLLRHVHMADALRNALVQNQFMVALQPKRMLRDGAHAGFEALARWHDGAGWVSPSAFIPVAEETGLIVPVGRMIMDLALARLQDIRAQGLHPGRVAVNVTGQQLLEPHFADETMAALERHDLGPADLELELSRTVLFGRASERIEAVLRALSLAGITLALDDFGTGYASLAHLTRLPIDRLKIDRSFVAGIGQGGPGGMIVRAVISLAHSLGMESIGKGVETTEQVAFLQTAGCDAAQGYLFARPLLTAAEAIAYLRQQIAPFVRPKPPAIQNASSP